MPYEDPFNDIVEIPYAYKVMNTFEDFIPRVKLRRKQQEFNPYKFLNRSLVFQMCNQVQVIFKLLVWSITLKWNFSTKEFIFDPGGLININFRRWVRFEDESF